MHEPCHVAIVVVGDLGRSPRMLNHALAAAERGGVVLLIGTGSSPIEQRVANHSRIRIVRLRDLVRAPEGSSSLAFIVRSAVRFAYLHAQVFWHLISAAPKPAAMLVQTPPAVPLLLCIRVAAWLRGSRAIADWHNLGYSVVALRAGAGRLTRIARACERLSGRLFDAHLCVSKAMRRRLASEFGIPDSVVLYDRPRRIASPLPRSERVALAARVLSAVGIHYGQEMGLIVCPTSWTADEDPSLLLDALAGWDAAADALRHPRLLVLITGLGPLRNAFEQRLAAMSFDRAEVHTAFFDPEAYRNLLRAADLGLCFHRSSSGIDLPMKMIDFLGAGAPACAFDYGECLREQVVSGGPALLFASSHELAVQLIRLFDGFPARRGPLERLRFASRPTQTGNWFEAWNLNAAALIPGLHHE